jgi:hypothetical protein
MNGSGMVLPQSGKALANESNYPYIVELAVGADEVDFGLSRRITSSRDMDEELLEGAKSIIAGAFPIWRRLAPLSSSLEESFSRVPFFKGSDFSDLEAFNDRFE